MDTLEGKDVIKIVKEIQSEKDKKEKVKNMKADKKVEERELFYKNAKRNAYVKQRGVLLHH